MNKKIPFILSIIALAVSLAAIYLVLSKGSDENHAGLIVSSLSVLVTALVGWQIYTLIDLRSYEKQFQKQLSEFDKLDKRFKEESELIKSDIRAELIMTICNNFVDVLSPSPIIGCKMFTDVVLEQMIDVAAIDAYNGNMERLKVTISTICDIIDNNPIAIPESSQSKINATIHERICDMRDNSKSSFAIQLLNDLNDKISSLPTF